MIKKIFNKILGKKSKEEVSQENLSKKFSEKSVKLIGFVEQKIKEGREEYFIIKEKMKDLRTTNYELGLKHLENGRLKDASFRFFLMRKFWPDYYEAYFQHAYCLILRRKNDAAKKVLEELLIKDPSYNAKAGELLEHIKQAQ